MLSSKAIKGADERVDKVLMDEKNVFQAIRAEDRITKWKSCLQRGGPVGNQRKGVEQEPQWHGVDFRSINKDIRTDMMRYEV